LSREIWIFIDDDVDPTGHPDRGNLGAPEISNLIARIKALLTAGIVIVVVDAHALVSDVISASIELSAGKRG